MSEPLRVLIVEDSADDVTLLLRHLRRDGYDPTFRRVDEARDMREALALETWDVVISDHAMPNFDALSALAVLKESQLDLPFIIVSGTIGEEVAVGAMKAGAHDYLMKNNLARLAPAVRRERQEAIVRRQMRQAEEDLRGYHAELETRVAERTAQLTEANERLAAGLDRSCCFLPTHPAGQNRMVASRFLYPRLYQKPSAGSRILPANLSNSLAFSRIS